MESNFQSVPNVHWIVIEDAKSNTNLVQNLLANCGVVYTLLNEPTPADQKLSSTDKNWLKPRGVHQRNAGLHWIRDAFRGIYDCEVLPIFQNKIMGWLNCF